MGKIIADVELIGHQITKRYRALLDSGAHRNYIRRVADDNADVNSLGFHTVQEQYPVILADRTHIYGIRARFNTIKIGEVPYTEPEFIVLKDLDEEMILGAVIMQELGIDLYPREEIYRIRPEAAGARIVKLS